MWEGCYGKEPFDLRLTALRLIANLDVVLVFTLAGTLLFGGGYYVKNVLLRSEKQYSVTSVYRVDYAIEEEKDIGSVYINEMSWNTYLHSQEFLNAVMKHLKENSLIMDSDWVSRIPEEEVSEALTAYLASDLRVPSTMVVTDFEAASLQIARAVEQTMTEEFPAWVKEISGIRVIDSPETASEVIPDVRPARAFALSAILSCFFTVVILLLKETGDDNIPPQSECVMAKRQRERSKAPGFPKISNISMKEKRRWQSVPCRRRPTPWKSLLPSGKKPGWSWRSGLQCRPPFSVRKAAGRCGRRRVSCWQCGQAPMAESNWNTAWNIWRSKAVMSHPFFCGRRMRSY